ncbi:MAG TPA: hypothetical protein PK878_02925 [bacterium]|mgnify:FL=1|nr:hypothetical protein [bacterium]
MPDFKPAGRFVLIAWGGWWLLSMLSLPLQAKELPALRVVDQDGVKIECLPDLLPVAKQLHPWYVNQLKTFPADLNSDIQQLIQNQDKIIGFLTKQMGLNEPSDFMKNHMPAFIAKYLEVGNPAPNPRHIQIWRRDDLKAYLDGGGSIPGYRYIPGKEGENQLIIEKRIAFTDKGVTQKDAGETVPLLPVVLKNENRKVDLDTAKAVLTEALDSIRRFAPLLTAACLQTQIEILVQENTYPTLSLIRWFRTGMSGYLTWSALQAFVSQDAAQIYLRTHHTQPFESKKNLVRLVEWIGDEPNDTPGPSPSGAPVDALERIRSAFAIREIMELVQRHNADIVPRLFTEIRKHAPSGEELKAAAQPDGKISGKIVIRDLNVLLDAIQTVTGEDFRPRLLQYSPVPAPGGRNPEAAAKSPPEKKNEKTPAQPPAKAPSKPKKK